jgi:hypothetical protein
MFKVTITWKDGPAWPGADVISTVEFMRLNGATDENLLFGTQLILSQSPFFVNFLKATTSEYDIENRVSWRTEIFLETQEQANIIRDYFATRATTEAIELNWTIDVELETL